MKKLIAIFMALVLFTSFALTVLLTPSTTLYFLNWGEYIDHSLIEKFQDLYHCQVIEETVVSSEAMYQKITSDTTKYDVAVPGDYTVHQLFNEGRLKELDIDNPEYKNLQNYKTMFNDSLKEIMDKYMVDEENNPFDSYYMPYFFGAYSILYNSSKEDVEDVVKDNGFLSLFDRSLYKEDVHIGMYSTARWIVSSYLLSKGLDPNITSYDGRKDKDLSIEIQKDIIKALKDVRFDEFGDDSLKRNVANNRLDLCFTQLGDFFDALYLILEEGNGGQKDFHVEVPKTTACFFDSMVIPDTCQNETLANRFIDFMMDPDNACQNARAIGYSPTLKPVDALFYSHAEEGEMYYEDDKTSLSLTQFLKDYPMYLNPLEGTEKVYLLEEKDNSYLTTCETIFNSLS